MSSRSKVYKRSDLVPNSHYLDLNLNSLEGKILIASPHLTDKYFSKAVIYICAHDQNGAIGILLNKRISLTPYEDFLKRFPEFSQYEISKTLIGKNLAFLLGGPLNDDKIIAISIDKYQESCFTNYKSISLHTDIAKFLTKIINKSIKPHKFLFVKGVSVWSPMQLEQEVQDNVWLIADASVNMIFSQKIKDKWVSGMQGIGIKNSSQFVNYCANAQ